MKISIKGRIIIRQHESERLTAYQDSVGVWTIGVGHTAKAGPPAPKRGMKITANQSDEILSRDLAGVEACLNRNIRVPVTQEQYDALGSLVFNIGDGNFEGSTLLRKLNARDYMGAANQFPVWCKGTVNGKKVTIKGLVNRREAERKLFLSGQHNIAITPSATIAKPAAPANNNSKNKSLWQIIKSWFGN